ncbi:MAG: radical SAM protein [Acutalibacteraceae bacterium]|nr:radical SAM protein [Acutalibacteraceae bacterium]
MRIFYSNITYGCNSNCVFCYSHNTRHNGCTHNEIDINRFFNYLKNQNICVADRVILNGGEPCLHSQFEHMLCELDKIGCEILVYTNGRLLNKLPKEILSSRMRFVVPIHGYKELHEKITGVIGSYDETIKGLEWITAPDSKCLADIKIIINSDMVDREMDKVIESLEDVPLNHAVHITKMADTKISKSNNCKSVDNVIAAEGTKRLFDYYYGRYKIKVFDTCVKKIGHLFPMQLEYQYDEVEVFFKDWSKNFKVDFEKPKLKCYLNCENRYVCLSAVGEYIALEIDTDKVSIGLE